MNRLLLGIFLAASLVAASVPSALAEEFYCEVMSVEGSVTLTNSAVNEKALQEGDVLQAEDVVKVGPGGYADLAYDREWNNVTRVEENSKIRIRSLYPTTLELESGGVYAKLKSLPKESSFNVQTPTAIASVRGTEYRTTFEENETQIYNLSDSDVFVYGLESSGEPQASPVVIRRSEKTQVIARGLPPVGPRRMEAKDLQRAEQFQQGIEKRVNENIAKGRFGKIPDIHDIEKRQVEKGRDVPLQGSPRGSAERKLTPEEQLKKLDDRPGNTDKNEEQGTGERQRNIPKTLSGDEAGEAAQNIAGDGRQEASRLLQRPEEKAASETSGQPGQPQREQGAQNNGSRLLKSMNSESPSEPPVGRKMDEAAQGGSSKQKEMPQNAQRQADETGQHVVHERRENGGQPFGPDPGRRPQDGAQNKPGNQPKSGGSARPAPKPSNR